MVDPDPQTPVTISPVLSFRHTGATDIDLSNLVSRLVSDPDTSVHFSGIETASTAG
jgi:hypothetical protein